MALSGDPYVYGSWTFQWYTPDQDIRPVAYLRALGISPPTKPPTPFLISDSDGGQTVRFQSLLGAYGPPYIPVDQDIPFLPGSQLKFINVEEAEVDLRVLFTADTQQLLWAKLNTMLYTFNPLRGIGILQVTNPAGQVRLLNATCISGFKLDPSTLQEKSVEAILTFYANNPYWYSPWITKSFTILPSSGFTPILPAPVARPGATTNVQQITTLGDVNTYAAFLFSAPYVNPEIINQSINALIGNNNSVLFSANGGVTSGSSNSSLLYDCINKNATYAAAVPGGPLTSVIPQMTQTSAFFPLLPSQLNVLYFELLNVNNNTAVQIFYQEAYSSMI